MKEAVSIERAEGHPGRFQINTPDRVWMLRTETEEECQQWVTAIKRHQKYVEPPQFATTQPGNRSMTISRAECPVS